MFKVLKLRIYIVISPTFRHHYGRHTTNCCSHALHSTSQHACSAHARRKSLYVCTVCMSIVAAQWRAKADTQAHIHTWHILNNMIRSSIRIKSSKWNDAIAVNNNNNSDSSEKSAATECSPEMILLFMCSLLQTLNSFFISSAVWVRVMCKERCSSGFGFQSENITRFTCSREHRNLCSKRTLCTARRKNPNPTSYALIKYFHKKINSKRRHILFIIMFVCLETCETRVSSCYHICTYNAQTGFELKLNNNVLCNRGE